MLIYLKNVLCRAAETIFSVPKKKISVNKRTLHLEMLEERHLLTVAGFYPNQSTVDNGQVDYLANFFSASEAALENLADQNNHVIAVEDIYHVNYGEVLQVNFENGFLANDVYEQDGESVLSQINQLQISIIAEPVHGTLQYQQDGSFSYSGESGFIGEEIITYRVTDSFGDYWDASVTFLVDAAKPVPQADIITVNSNNGTFHANALLANDFIQGTNTSDLTDVYHIVFQENPQHGTLLFNEDGTFDYTPQSGFEGVEVLTYQILDNEENVLGENTVFIQIENPNASVLPTQPLPGGYNTNVNSEEFGKISLGGNQSQITTSAPFIPSSLGNYQSVENAARQTQTTLNNVNGLEISGENTENLSISVISQDFGNGNWHYSETSSYSYFIDAGDESYWGGYVSILIASLIDGVYNLSYYQTTSDNFSAQERTDNETENSHYHLTTTAIGGQANTIVITQNYDTETSSLNAGNSQTVSDILFCYTVGSYTYTTQDGFVSGIISQSSENLNRSGISIVKNETANTPATYSGSQFSTMIETSRDFYLGSGIYHYEIQDDNSSSKMSGILGEHGSNYNSTYLAASGLLDSSGDWHFIGSGVTDSTSYEAYLNVGLGTYSQWNVQPENSWSVQGTQSTGTYDRQRSMNHVTLSLSDDETWEISLGNGYEIGYSQNSYRYNGSGDYSRSGNSEGNAWNTSGTLSQSGNHHEKSYYVVDFHWLNGEWYNTGWGNSSGDEDSVSSYEGSGFYTSLFDEGDSHFSISGTTTEHGSDSSETNYSTYSTLNNDSWQTTGDGSGSSETEESSSYTGSGSFQMKVNAPNVIGESYYIGSASQNGNSYFDSSYQSSLILQDGDWTQASGTGDSFDSNFSYLDFDGVAETSEEYLQNEISHTTSTHRSIEGSEQDNAEFHQYFQVVDGEWEIASGTGVESGFTHFHSDYEISSGNYSYNKATSSGYEGNSSSHSEASSGTIEGSGGVTDNYSYDVNYELLNHEWIGTGLLSYEYSSSDVFKREGTGTFFDETETTSPSNHSWNHTSGTIASEIYETSSFYYDHYQESLNADGSRTLVNGGIAFSSYNDNEEIHWKGSGTFGETYSENDSDGIAQFVINGDTEFEKNWAWQSGGNEWQKIIDNEWQLFSGTSLEQENEDSSATREGSGTMTKQGKSYTITTNQSDTTDYDFTYNGLVKNNQDGEKEWKYSGEVHDKAAGNYTLIVPLRETTYERTITGGSVSGTVKEELLKGNSYDIDITNTLAENDTAWGITAGTKKYGNTVTSKESYEGAGNYSYMTSDSVQLFGNVEESGEYSITTNGVQQTLTYNTVTKEWDESNAGTIIYQDKVKFKDTGGGSFDNGKGVINERTANYEGEYTETVYLDDDKIDYHWLYHTSEKYDAAKTDDHFGSIDGNYLLADQYTYDFQVNIDWDTDLAGWLGDYDGTRTAVFTEDIDESFAIGEGGNEIYDSYYFDNAEHYSQNSVKKLEVERSLLDFLFTFEETFWNDMFWLPDSLTAKHETEIKNGYSQSGTNENVSGTVNNKGFSNGTSEFSEDYSYYQKLTQNLTYTEPTDEEDDGYSVTGNGVEKISREHRDSYNGEYNYESYGFDDSNYPELSGSSSSYKLYHSDLIYVWNDNAENWHISGTGIAENGFSYDWNETYSYNYSNGFSTRESGAEHEEIATVHWDYDNYGSGWTYASVDGGGSGVYYENYHYETSNDYSYGFYAGTRIGHEESNENTVREDTWNVTYSLLNNKVVRESDGGISMTINKYSSFWEEGESHENVGTSQNVTSNYYQSYNGTQTTLYECDAVLSDSGTQSYCETITATWSNRADENGNLFYTVSADSDITVISIGDYSAYWRVYYNDEFNGSYSNIYNYEDCCDYHYTSTSGGTQHTFYDNESVIALSESYYAELHESRHSDGGVFERVSYCGFAIGSGNSNTAYNSSGESNVRSSWSEYGSSYQYSDSQEQNSDYSYNETTAANYNYTAAWSWDKENGASSSITNNTSGNGYYSYDGNDSYSYYSSYYYADSGGEYYSSSDNSYSYSTVYFDYNTAEQQYTGWGSQGGQATAPFSIKRTAFYGNIYDYSYGDEYSYHYEYFSAPNFSVSTYDENYYGYEYEYNDVWHSGCSNYYSSCYYYSNFISASHTPTGSALTSMIYVNKSHESLKLITTGEPNFKNYGVVDVKGILDAAFPEPKIILPVFTAISTPVEGISEPIPDESWWWAGTKAFCSEFFSVHNTLDVIGLIPILGEPADCVNGLIYFAEGDKINGTLSFIAMVPFGGAFATTGKAVKKISGAVGDLTGQVTKHADDVAEVGKQVAKNADKAKVKKAATITENAVDGAKTMNKAIDAKKGVQIEVSPENKIDRNLLDTPAKSGNAPTFKKDGKPVEIHHEGQNSKGPYKEMHPNDHRGKGNDAVNHPEKNKPSQIDRKEFNKARKEYWKKEYAN